MEILEVQVIISSYPYQRKIKMQGFVDWNQQNFKQTKYMTLQ